MSTNTLKTRIRNASKTESEWASSNPVLLSGEIAYSSDMNGKYKIGDGTSTWSQLPYAIPVTKADIGLGNVENKSSATIRGELTKANVTNALGYTPPTTNTTYGVATSSTLGLVKSGTDITVDSSGNVSVKDDSHNHVISNVDGLQSALDSKYEYSVIRDSNTVLAAPNGSNGSASFRKLVSSDLPAHTHTKSQITDLNKNLTSEDLNNVKTVGFYYAGGNNSITNKPSGVDAFGLEVLQSANGWYTQVLYASNNATKSYRRWFNGNTWTSWTEDKLTDTNTWRGIQNNLTSDSTTDSLSAAQGKALKALVDAKSSLGHTHDDRYYTESEMDTKLNAKLNTSLKGTASGLAELDSTGRVPSSQLPSYVDDVIEGYLYNSKFYKESAHTTVITGESGKIYVDLTSNKTYRWSGSAFTVISETLALGETSTTAYRGDRGKIAYDHSQVAHAPSNAEVNQNAFSNVVVGSTTIAADTKTDTLTLVAGSNVTLTPDATNDKITISSTDTNDKVTQNAVTDSSYTNWRSLIWGASNSGTEGFTPTTVTDGVFSCTGLSVQPSTGTIRASVFKGNLSGNATSANKWATARTLSLTGAVTGSASIDGSGNVSLATSVNHTHNYLPLSGGTLTGNLSIQNESPVFTMKNTNSTEVSVVFDRNENANWKILVQGGILKFQNDWVNNVKGNYFDALTITHQTGNAVFKGTVTAPTFNGSLSGNATSATKLTTSAGSSTQPVYFSDGKPVVCTYTLGKSVPSDAVFTDTKNTSGSTDTSSKIFLIGATSQAANPQTYSDNEVYTTSGVLTTKSVQVGGGLVTLQYNSSTESLDFVFS